MASQRKRSTGRESLRSSVAYGRPSVGASASKIPRSTPLMHSSRKVLPSASKSVSKRSYFSSSDHHFIKDPRPVTDKSQMRKCINEIILTLAQYGYPNSLTLKLMNPPTNKEYFRIVEFVYRLVSPTYDMIVKPDEETAKILSDLGYPISISKSTLNNIGAMSAWPNALAALDWLLDWAKCFQASEEVAEKSLFGEMKLPALYDYLKATYIAFMHGKNAPFEDIDEVLDRKIEEMGRDQVDANKQEEQECKELQAELEALKAEKEAILNLELEKTQIQTVKQNLDQYFEQLEPYFASLKERSEATNKEIDTIRKSTSLLEREKLGIESTVSDQQLSISDLQHMEIAIAEVENKIRSTEERTNQAQERFYEKQIQEAKMNDKINSQVAEYREICQKLEIVGVQNGGAEEFALTSDRADIDKNVGKLLSKIRPKAIEMKSLLLKELGRLQNIDMHNVDTLKQLEEEIADRKHAIDSLQKQIENLQKEEQKIQEEFLKKEDKENAELADIEEAIKRQTVVNNLSVDDAREILDTEKKYWEETKMRVEKEAAECEESFNELYSMCCDYQDKMRKLLHSFHKNTENSIQDFSSKMQQHHSSMLDQRERFEKTLKEMMDLDEKYEQTST